MCFQFAHLRRLAGGLKVEEAAGEGRAGGEAGGSCAPHGHRLVGVGVVEAGSDEARVGTFGGEGGKEGIYLRGECIGPTKNGSGPSWGGGGRAHLSIKIKRGDW